MRRALVLALLVGGLALISSPRSASAQVSVWLQKGVSGVGGSVLFHHDGDVNIYGVNAGYSLRGWVDFDLTIGYATFEDDSLGDDLAGAEITPRAEVHPLKQGPGMPVSVGIGAGVSGAALSSEELDQRDIDVGLVGVNADVAVYRFFKLSSNIGISPAAEVDYTHAWITVSQFGDEIDTTDEGHFSFAFASYVAYLDRAGHIWGVAPGVGIDDDGELSFILRAGIVLTL
jgi:hypothetical protein